MKGESIVLISPQLWKHLVILTTTIVRSRNDGVARPGKDEGVDTLTMVLVHGLLRKESVPVDSVHPHGTLIVATVSFKRQLCQSVKSRFVAKRYVHGKYRMAIRCVSRARK